MIIVKKKIKLFLVVVMTTLLVACSKDGYRVEGSRVVYEVPWNTGNLTVIHDLDADPSTFQVLGEDNLTWAKDDTKVFRRYSAIDFLDSDSFEVLSINFAKDKNHVICGRDIIKETNPEDFSVRFYTTKSGYQYIYGVDKKAAYLCSRSPNGYIRRPSDSIEQFQQLEGEFFKDKTTVSWSSRVLSNVKASEFRSLGGGYGTDGNFIYYTDDIVHGADLATFVVTESAYARDKNHRYFMEQIDD